MLKKLSAVPFDVKPVRGNSRQLQRLLNRVTYKQMREKPRAMKPQVTDLKYGNKLNTEKRK